MLKRVEDTLIGQEEPDRNRAYQGLLLEETKTETEWREAVEINASLSAEKKAKQLSKLDDGYYYRRIINASYFKQVKTLIESGNYI